MDWEFAPRRATPQNRSMQKYNVTKMHYNSALTIAYMQQA
jgi:hypothetical protein